MKGDIFMEEEKIKKLKEYFSGCSYIDMAFLFGSRANGQETIESDVDIAVYFKPEWGKLEWEAQGEYEKENEIWSDVEDILKLQTDLVVLNRAPSTLADTIIREGIPIIIKNKKQHLGFLLAVTSDATDFRELVRDFWEIKQRSLSLSEQDKERLIKIYDFLESELDDYSNFKDLNMQSYEENKHLRRSAERWTENIVNASVDMAKIILASNKTRIPETYKDVLLKLSLISGFEREKAETMADFARLRNILAHEYLDMRYNRIKNFMQKAPSAYKYLLDFTKNIVNA